MVRDKILETVEKYNLIEKDDVLLVAVSGGPDSMCLLDNLVNLKERLQIKEIVVAHLNHLIREEAKSETEYVEEYCKNKNIKCFVKFVDVIKIAQEEKIGVEEAGRKERYAFFDEIANKVSANKIVIAHNLNDNAETILMHILRGSGISGLCGIKPYREGKFIRPLIKCERSEIEKYCEEEHLNPKYDKSNEDNSYTRNRIRNELIPYIKKEFNPNIIETLDRLSELITDEENYMEQVVAKEYNEILIKNENNSNKIKEESIANSNNCEKIVDNNKEIILDLKKFNSLDNLIKSRIIMYTVKKLFGTSNGIEKIHIEDIIKLCGNNIGNKYLTPNKNIKVTVKNKRIYFEKIL
ncbi:MAG: tRNA lysidine(34) synthetase TilS [Clostridia bacterium]